MTDHSFGDTLRSRRRLLGLTGAGASAAALGAWSLLKGMPGPDGSLTVVPPPPKLRSRPAGFSAAEADGFANRDASFAAAGAKPAAVDQTARLYATPSEAARSTPVTVATILAKDNPLLHMLRRTSFGPTPSSQAEATGAGIDAWLAQQLDPASIADAPGDQAWALFPHAAESAAEIRGSIERYRWDAMMDFGMAVLARQIWSKRQLFEIMADFWGNHLNVTVPSGPAWDVGGPYHNEVTRQHALGNFTDMLLAAMRHPAMLRYLTNSTSTKESVNENLGRELLELHTVGVGSGYTEDDVRNSAYILTGRTVTTDMMGDADAAEFRYDAERHWTGAVQVLDFRHANATGAGGLDVGEAYLRYLAGHPATARTIARKIAVRFVSDNPPDSLVERLATAYLDAGTEIAPVLEILFRSGEFWAAVGQKTRRPTENMVATARVLDVRPGNDTTNMIESAYWFSQKMGHAPLAWPAPNGYPDVQAAWRSTSSLLETWNFHRGLIQGWAEGATYTEAEALTEDLPRATVGQYVDSLCQRLCFQSFAPEHRAAIAAFVAASEATPTADSEMEWRLKDMIPLVLDSPYFAIR
jgi:uncharacterized protein (DUF1800 family)